MSPYRWIAILILLAGAAPVRAQAPIIAAASQWIQKHPTLERRIGFAELQRVHISAKAGIDELRKIATDYPNAVEVQELLCWRMLPVAPAQGDDFRREVSRLKAIDPNNRWVGVWEMCLLASQSNRTALLNAVNGNYTQGPNHFPTALAESAHLELLRELGIARVQAGVEVISARNYEPLHALRDLDRTLTREAEFADSAGRLVEAKAIRARREEYRRGYLGASKHLVEKLFALRLIGATGERDGLLAAAKALSVLHDRRQLANLLTRLDEGQAWQRLIEPLLASELALLASSPQFPELNVLAVAELQVKARNKSVHDKTVHYDGDVRVRLAGIEARCNEMTVLQRDNPAGVVVNGTESVHLVGLADYPAGIDAERFTYHAETGAFTLGGDIRMHALGKTIKLRACTLTQTGAVRDARSLLDDFRAAGSIDAKLALLPKITKVYDDAELPAEVRFLFAMSLVRPHLEWHAPYLPPQLDRYRDRYDEIARKRYSDATYPWQAAQRGEAWMLGDIPEATVEGFRASLRAWYKQFNADPRNENAAPPDIPLPAKDLYFWRLRDPGHADVVRAIRLLGGVDSEELGPKARRWAAELRRNNTVVTFDIAGGAYVGRKHSLLMDVRNAETVSFKLYRVRDPRELLHATANIGSDFVYRDHRLDDRDSRGLVKQVERLYKITSRLESREADSGRDFMPSWKKDQLVRQWTERVADLPHGPGERRHHRYWRDDYYWNDEADSHYFDDECSSHQLRLDKFYRANAEHPSSWQCDRVVQIPEKVLSEAGAYVLVAEANGQTAHVPIVVEPISLTLRRCRDGVFVLASDVQGQKPLEGATVHAFGQKETATTDKEGVAFARFLAFGERAIVVHHQGRFAIGGFGKVFESIYDVDDDDEHPFVFDRLAMERKSRRDESHASVYADQHAVVAYTDRPTYRPGQDVQFKLIVRKLVPEKMPGVLGGFRSEDFDAKTKLVLPNLEREVRYSILDPKGHVVADGPLNLSEFGTAAGVYKLNAEDAVGSYTMRVHLAGQPRIVPDVFAVQHYRRPNVEMKVSGVPAKLTKPDSLTLTVAGRYYFGPAVAGGSVEVRVVRKDFGKAIADVHGKLDDQGEAKVVVGLPKSLAPGAYVVVTSVTDESGRAVKSSSPFVYETPDGPKGNNGLDALPRFVAVGAELRLATTAQEVRAIKDLTDLTFTPKDGVALLKFPVTGWYRLKAGDDETMLFVHGGDEHPLRYSDVENDARRHVTRLRPSGWVNLSDYAWQEDGHLSRWERPSHHLFALFDRQSLKVGDKLRMLVYVPRKNANLLFTIEGRTVLDYVTLWAKDAGYQVIELPMKDRYFPNAYVQGRILTQDADTKRNGASKAYDRMRPLLERDDDDGVDPRWCRIDVAKATGPFDGPALDVRIDTDRATYRPGDSVRASIKVTDRAGRPQAAEVSLAAVDESVFAFGEDNLDAIPGFFRMPYETRRFLPKVWRSSVGSRWIYKERDAKLVNIIRNMAKAAEMMQKMDSARLESKSLDRPLDAQPQFVAAPLPRLGGEMPSKQVPLSHLREHFQETATWLPRLRTDETGTANVAFTLPDSLTRYRLTSLAVTKGTELGVGRARITAGLPLAVQVFVPRFAIERDRLLAVALVHNHTNEPRECVFAWDIAGATAEPPAPLPDDWKLVHEAGKYVASGRIQAPAKGSVKVGIWLKADTIGVARIQFRASAGKESDAEVRTLPVQPLGKPVDINANAELPAVQVKPAEKVVAGVFHREGRVQLPAGFVARELHISMAASEMAQALDGLDYLVDYPHGCIEQTMSRFMPAVMIRHATQNSPIVLQPEIARKLPDVLKQGLTRVYGHQHADGSWGWFAQDGRNLPMSVYVVYGLSRCKATGTPVDADVLSRGCAYILQELRTGKHDPELVARAWHALAIASHADAKELSAFAAQEAKLIRQHRPVVTCNLALACKTAGLNELAEQFWSARDAHWTGHDTETNALVLNAQLAFGAPYRDCRTTAGRLLARRTGTRWDHTRDTAWAIEALANMLGYVPEKSGVRKIEFSLAGKTILEIGDPAELKKLAWRVKLGADKLAGDAGVEIRFKADSDEPIYVAVRASGVQRQDEVRASGQRVKLQRFLETLDGQPATGPFKIGQVVRVRLKLQLQDRADYLLLEERRPALCEFADDRIAGASAREAVHQEFRDDRLCVYFASLAAGTHEIVYYLRAETAGQCSVLPGVAYPMYDDKTRGETSSARVVVQP